MNLKEFLTKSNVIIIVLILILIYYSISLANANEQFIYGFWVGDDAFCQRASISSFMIFIGEPEGYYWRRRNAYIVITSDNEVIINEGFIMNYSRNFICSPGRQYKINASIDFDNTKLWPDDSIEFKFNMTNGYLSIYGKDNELYGLLYKDSKISNILD